MKKILEENNQKGILRYAVVFNENKSSEGKERYICENVLDSHSIKVQNEFSVNNFIEDKNEKLIILTGIFNIDN